MQIYKGSCSLLFILFITSSCLPPPHKRVAVKPLKSPSTEKQPQESSDAGKKNDPIAVPQSPSPTTDQKPNPPPPQPNPEMPNDFVNLLSEAEFNQLYPTRNPFYTYSGLIEAAQATAGFAKEGSLEDRKRELAALLANGEHESDHFKATREYNMANWSLYCDQGNTEFPCAKGQQYYGRGPIQLSWNYNYGLAGKAIGVDLLANPDLVATNPKIAWQTMMWYWMTQKGPGTMTPHEAIMKSQSFGETIRSINGALECNGKNSEQVNSRVRYYENVLKVLKIGPGSGNIRC